MSRLLNKRIINQVVAARGRGIHAVALSSSVVADGNNKQPRSHHQLQNINLPPIRTSFSPLQTTSALLLHQQIIIPTNFSTMPQQELSDEVHQPLQQQPSATKKQQQQIKRKKKKRINPLIITPTAAARIQYLIDQHNSSRGGDDGDNTNHAVGIRLGTKKRGCNGLSYTLNYAYDNHKEQHKRDEGMVIQFDDDSKQGNGLQIFIEPMALMNIIGTTMDFVDDEMSSEFIFINPNSKGECGCGESFNV